MTLGLNLMIQAHQDIYYARKRVGALLVFLHIFSVTTGSCKIPRVANVTWLCRFEEDLREKEWMRWIGG